MNGIEVNCPNGKILYKDDTNVSPKLEYKDENSGEYNCNGDQKILIKFRSKFCLVLGPSKRTHFLIFVFLFSLMFIMNTAFFDSNLTLKGHIPFSLCLCLCVCVYVCGVCVCAHMKPVTTVWILTWHQ